MKKFFSITMLLLFIGTLVAGAAARLAAPGSPENYFNKHWRVPASRYPVLREILSLHDAGDARFDYLGSRYSNIIIEVDAMESLTIPEPEIQALANRIAALTGKSVSYQLSNLDLQLYSTSNQADIDEIIRRYRTYYTEDDTAAFYILLANQDMEEPLLIGKTYREFGTVIYYHALQEFTGDNARTMPLYISSTALHEFGHLLGLQHNDQAGCLMGERAESDRVAKTNPKDIVIDFCKYEKDLLLKKRRER